MGKTPVKIKRPLWVAGLNIALALTVGATEAFAGNITSVAELLAVTGDSAYVLTKSLDLSTAGATSDAEAIQLAGVGDNVVNFDGAPVLEDGIQAVGSTTYISGAFTGTLDGGGFTISGLTKPLFEVIDGDESSPDTTISNLTLEADTDGVTGRGILAIEALPGTVIDDVHVTGDVNGDSNVGGLLGINFGGITNSSATGNVGGTDYIGGLVGLSTGNITNSYAEVTVDGDGGIGRIGGLVGYSEGAITNSYATGDVEGINYVGGLVGFGLAAITNSYAAGNVTGDRVVGGLVATALGNISNSYASGNVKADDIYYDSSEYFGGLAAEAYYPITNSYASGNVTAVGSNIGGLVGFEWGDIVFDSYTSGNVNDTPCIEPCSPLTATELLVILNTGSVSPIFAIDSNINGDQPYLLSNPPGNDGGNDGGNDEVVEVSIRIDFSSFLPTLVLDGLSKSVGFEAAKSELNKLDLAFLDQVKGEKAAPITGAKLFANQSLTTSLSVGSLLQLEINFEANKSLQMWVKSSDNQYVLVGDITFDKDGNAVLPGIEFKKGGSYEFIFVNSDKKDLTQPELVNKVSGLTVYVSE